MRGPQRIHELQTEQEAQTYLREAFATQLESSIRSNADPNTQIPGDYGAKTAFKILLSPNQQRAFFQRLIGDERYWPRIKTLIGNPPYSFLMPEDEGLIRPGGICRKRSHLASNQSSMSKVEDFGIGHYRDESERVYRIIADGKKGTTLPWRNVGSEGKLVLDVKLKAYSHQQKLEILRGRDGQVSMTSSLTFPRPSDIITLQLSEYLHDAGHSNTITIRIESGQQKVRNSPIARLLVTVIRA